MKHLVCATLALTTMTATATSAYAQMETRQAMAHGMFAGVDGHHTEGEARIEKRADGIYVVLGSDFKTDMGPDLRVVLRDSTGMKPMAMIAPLKATSGAQEYMVMMDENTVAGFDQVVIYCLQFHVDFGIAGLMAKAPSGF